MLQIMWRKCAEGLTTEEANYVDIDIVDRLIVVLFCSTSLFFACSLVTAVCFIAESLAVCFIAESFLFCHRNFDYFSKVLSAHGCKWKLNRQSSQKITKILISEICNNFILPTPRYTPGKIRLDFQTVWHQQGWTDNKRSELIEYWQFSRGIYIGD